MASKANVRKLKKWARDHHDLGMTVLKATAFAQLERERVDAYVRPIFLRYEFRHEGTGEILTDPDRIYLAGDSPEVEARCKEYFAECDRAHREHGFDGPDGHCPALVAESLQRDAEQLLLDAMAQMSSDATGTPVDGIDFCRSLELRAKALDWALTVTVNAERMEGI